MCNFFKLVSIWLFEKKYELQIKILKNSNPKGIYFSHQLHEPKKFMDSLTSNKSITIH
jgi:hypothetical protein